MSALNRLAVRVAWDLGVSVRELYLGLKWGPFCALVAVALIVAMLGVKA